MEEINNYTNKYKSITLKKDKQGTLLGNLGTFTQGCIIRNPQFLTLFHIKFFLNQYVQVFFLVCMSVIVCVYV